MTKLNFIYCNKNFEGRGILVLEKRYYLDLFNYNNGIYIGTKIIYKNADNTQKPIIFGLKYWSNKMGEL